MYIMAEILRIASDGALQTQIMYRANLSFTQVNDYLSFMLGIGLLEVRNDAYITTKKGLDFLQRYTQIRELMKDVDSHQYMHKDNSYSIKSELHELKKAIKNLEIKLSYKVKCPNCQEDIFPDYKFCPYCGNKRIREAVKSEAR